MMNTTSRINKRNSDYASQSRIDVAHRLILSRSQHGSHSLHTSNTTLSNRQRRRKSRQGIIKRADNSQIGRAPRRERAQISGGDGSLKKHGHSRTGSSQTHSSRTGSSRTSKLRTTTSRRKQRSSNTTRQTRNAEAHRLSLPRSQHGSHSLHTSNTTLSNRQRRRKSRQGIIKRSDNSQCESDRLSRQAQRRSSDRHNSRPGHSRTGSSQTHSSRTGSSRTSKLRTTTSRFILNDTATTEIYTLSLHDALPISRSQHGSHSLHTSNTTLSNRQRRRKSRQGIIK